MSSLALRLILDRTNKIETLSNFFKKKPKEPNYLLLILAVTGCGNWTLEALWVKALCPLRSAGPACPLDLGLTFPFAHFVPFTFALSEGDLQSNLKILFLLLFIIGVFVLVLGVEIRPSHGRQVLYHE